MYADTEVNRETIRKYYHDESIVARIFLAINSSVNSVTKQVEHVIYKDGRFVTRISAMPHWKLSDIWDKVEERFKRSATSDQINLDLWRMIARIVLSELHENVRIEKHGRKV